MPVWRATMFFHYGPYGWTETHWLNRSVTDYDTVLAFGRGLAGVRATCLCPGAMLDSVRVSDDLVKRDSFVAQLNYTNDNNPIGQTAPGDESFGPAPFYVLNLRLQGTALYRKTVYLGAVPLAAAGAWNPLVLPDWFKRALGVSTANKLIVKPVQGYAAELIDRWGWKRRSPQGTPPVWRRAQLTATVAAGIVGSVEIVDPGAGYLFAPQITFRSSFGRGAAATATVTGGVVTAVTVTSGGAGYLVSPQVFATEPPMVVQPYDGLIMRKVTERKRGRPSDGPVGRRRSVRVA